MSGKNPLLNNKIKYGWQQQEYQKLKLSGVCWVMYFLFNWHMLLNQMVVFVFSSFSFVFLWAYADFACWALIRYIKYIKDQKMQFNFIDILLLYYGHQQVSAIYVPIFMVISLRTRTQL
jgi:hypothetical protein